MERWKPPNQGRTAPRHMSWSVATIESSLFPHALHRRLTFLLVELVSSSPYASALGSHRSLSLQDYLHKVHPFFKTKFKCSCSLAPKHFSFSSVITLFDWGLFPCLWLTWNYNVLRKAHTHLVQFGLSPWPARFRTRGRCGFIGTRLLLNECTSQQHYDFTK